MEVQVGTAAEVADVEAIEMGSAAPEADGADQDDTGWGRQYESWETVRDPCGEDHQEQGRLALAEGAPGKASWVPAVDSQDGHAAFEGARSRAGRMDSTVVEEVLGREFVQADGSTLSHQVLVEEGLEVAAAAEARPTEEQRDREWRQAGKPADARPGEQVHSLGWVRRWSFDRSVEAADAP